jgi:hypothetical protein
VIDARAIKDADRPPPSGAARFGLMPKHTHRFVEDYDGLVGFGLDRTTDENTVRCYLQKFSDDAVTAAVLKRLDAAELAEIFDLISRLLRRHLSEDEYHRLFLKE